jgi:hypothetical protein
MTISRDNIDEILDKLTTSTHNNAIEAAAKVARIYGADQVVIDHILMLRSTAKEEVVS